MQERYTGHWENLLDNKEDLEVVGETLNFLMRDYGSDILGVDINPQVLRSAYDQYWVYDTKKDKIYGRRAPEAKLKENEYLLIFSRLPHEKIIQDTISRIGVFPRKILVLESKEGVHEINIGDKKIGIIDVLNYKWWLDTDEEFDCVSCCESFDYWTMEASHFRCPQCNFDFTSLYYPSQIRPPVKH